MKSKMFEVHCTKCDSIWMIKAESIVHAQSEKDLRNKILLQAFFTRKCSKCDSLLTFYYPFLYCDSENYFMIALCEQEAQWIKDIEKLPQYDAFDKRIVDSEVALKEMILIFENGLSDLSVLEMKEMLYEKYGQLQLEDIDDHYFWFQSDRGTIGISKAYYQIKKVYNKKFIRR